MKGIIFRKGFLVGGIFLLAIFISVQSSWGCDDDDDHGKHCRRQLVIQSVDVDLENSQILIHGQNFDNGRRPVVTLGGSIELQVTSYTENEIVTKLSEDNLEDIKDSDYRLVVSTGRGKKCRDRYSLTIAAPTEPQGKPGIIKSEVVEVTKTVIVTEATPITDPDFKIEDTASCNTLGAGWTVTGGGFSSSKKLSIDVSTPVINKNGWHVVGTPVLSNIDLGGDTLEIKIHAVCAIVQ